METVGQVLRAAREKQGLTLKDAEKGTSIRVLYLKAIEEGTYSVVPGEVYLKGFIRNYAIFLGLDAQEMVKLYKDEKSVETEIPEPEQEPDHSITEISSIQHTKTTTILPKLIVASVAIIVLAGGSWWMINNKLSSTPSAPTPQPQVQTQVQPQTVQNPPQQPQTKPVMVTAKYIEPCWTLVTADGKQLFEGTPKVGDILTWEAQKSVTIKLGNAGAVEMTYNGQPVAKIGGKGEVAVKTFTVGQ